MCGFVYVNSEKIDKSSVDKALNEIKYRGPDFKDTKAYDANFFLSHCRLSILDVNERSNQPMRSKNNEYSIIFNGEIYNYKAIAKKLNLKLKTTSDTEVILEGYAKIGNEIFQLLDGMFSLESGLKYNDNGKTDDATFADSVELHVSEFHALAADT